ncbi:hypothetical protein DPMN_085276, partial [Dreissena polymorpha]
MVKKKRLGALKQSHMMPKTVCELPDSRKNPYVNFRIVVDGSKDQKDLQGGTKQKYTNMEDVRVLDEIEVDSKVDSTTSESEDSEEEIDVSIFGDSSGIADVVLIIEGTSIPVVKSVLSIASPVFKVMFTGDFAEKSQKGIDLPGKDLQSFLSFLRCIYPDHRDRVT